MDPIRSGPPWNRLLGRQIVKCRLPFKRQEVELNRGVGGALMWEVGGRDKSANVACRFKKKKSHMPLLLLPTCHMSNLRNRDIAFH